jgi:hypothetical protein
MLLEFLFFAGCIRLHLHCNELRGVKRVDEGMGGLTWTADKGAATMQEEFASEVGFRALQGIAKGLEAAAGCKERVYIVGDGLPGGWQGAGSRWWFVAWQIPSLGPVFANFFVGLSLFGGTLIVGSHGRARPRTNDGRIEAREAGMATDGIMPMEMPAE